MTRCHGQSAPNTRSQPLIVPCCSFRRSLGKSSGLGLRRSSGQDVSVSAIPVGRNAGSLPSDLCGGQHHTSSFSCRAVLVEDREVVAVPTVSSSVETPRGAAGSSQSTQVQSIDVAVIGADVAGLATALATARAHPGSRITLYDTASEPPPAGDGGVLLSVNGLRAMKALDTSLYERVTSELASPVHEALWFDLEGELLRRAPLGQSSSRAGGGGGAAGSGGSRRRSAARRPPARSGGGEPDPAAPPLVISLHDLREALAEALPADVEIFGRHHVTSVEPCSSTPAAAAAGSNTLLRFATSPGGPVMREVRTRLVVGADGRKSAVKRLLFHKGSEPARPQAPQPQPPAQPAGRVVWRGRFTLRPRDPDFARLRSFTTASRTWLDLRATPGSERSATLTPAGPHTFVWTASCPAALLASRGLQEQGGASPYWRCLAMFEDFPQDFFASLRATAAKAVVEYDTCLPPTEACASSLAAPWQWFSGTAALVGDAVYALPVDDASSTAINLALEDAAVLGACTAQYGLTQRALQEYARQRGPRVSVMLSLPSSALERSRLRDAAFLPYTSSATQTAAAAMDASATAAAAAEGTSLASAVEAAVDSAAAAAAAVASPRQPLEQILAICEEASAPASTGAAAAAGLSPAAVPNTPADLPPLVVPGRPSGGATRTLAPGPQMPVPVPLPSGPSSPLFSRPSGARRWGPVPAAIAAVLGILGAGSSRAASAVTFTAATSAAAAAGAAAPAAAAYPSTPDPGKDVAAPSAAVVTGPVVPASAASAPKTYAVESSARSVWDLLLATQGSTSACGSSELLAAGTASGASSGEAAAPSREYCSEGTPMAVWQALLVAPSKAHDMLLKLPYNAAESPALVWMALRGAQAVSPMTSSRPSTSPSAAGAPSSAPSAQQDTPCTLLPRPVLKQKQPAAAAATATAPAAVEAAAAAAQPTSPEAAVSMAASTGAPPQLQLQSAEVTADSTPTSSGLQTQRRRRPRSQAGPVSGRWAGGDRRGRGKAAGGHGKQRRTAAAAATAASSGAVTAAPSSLPPSAASKAKAVAAKAAATMTVSLGAAAALGGVIGAGAGHMPYDVAAAAALHAHGTVAQFWEDLNNLTISSASLSSIDLS